MIDPVANEQSLRYLAAELQRAQLNAAQLAGNLAITQVRLADAQRLLAEHEGKPAKSARRRTQERKAERAAAASGR